MRILGNAAFGRTPMLGLLGNAGLLSTIKGYIPNGLAIDLEKSTNAFGLKGQNHMNHYKHRYPAAFLLPSL
jgi:hypothetical protein